MPLHLIRLGRISRDDHDGLGEHPPGPIPEDLGEYVLAGGRGTTSIPVVDSFMAGYSSASQANWRARDGCITRDTPLPFEVTYTILGYTPQAKVCSPMRTHAKYGRLMSPQI